jgi:glucan biosynthesis protein C
LEQKYYQEFLPFFLTGFICFARASLLDETIKVRAFDFIVLTALFVVKQVVHIENHYAVLFVEWMLWYQTAWTIGMLTVYLSKRFLDIESRLMRKVADAGYSIYLLHQIIVVALVTLFVGAVIPGGIATKYVVVVAGTLILTFFLHHGLIARYRITRVLLNGRLDEPVHKIRSGSRSPSTAG